jgi:hypothetical protein
MRTRHQKDAQRAVIKDNFSFSSSGKVRPDQTFACVLPGRKFFFSHSRLSRVSPREVICCAPAENCT